jgi:PAS domain S-box-containing protein
VARKKEKTKEELLGEVSELRLRLDEAEETLRAIRQGQVDALVVSGPRGDQVYSLQGVEHTYRVLVESMNEGAITLTEGGEIIYCNRAFARMAGTPCGKMVGGSFRDLVSGKDKTRFDILWENTLQGTGTAEIELKLNGGRLPVYLSCSTRVQDEVLTVFAIATDISERKQAERVQHRQAALLRLSHDAIIVWRPDGGIVSWSSGAEQLYGFAETEVVGKTTHKALATIFPKPLAQIEADLREKGQWEGELRHHTKDGREVIVSARLQLIRGDDDVDVVLEINRDITDRRRAKDRISRLNRFYSVLSKVNETIVRIHDSQELFDQVCRIVVEDGVFKMAWIGLVDPDSRMVKPTASYGDTNGYLTGLKVYAADVPEGKGPTGEAICKCEHSIAGDIENDPRMLPWRDRALRCGLRSSSAFPIHAGSSVIGALTVYSHEPQFFTDEEIQLVTSLAEDVSFALDSIANEKRRLEAEEALRGVNKELEQRIAVRTADLEAANKELEAFSYSVSHDLRSPLRHMSGFVELLQRRLVDHADEKTRTYADAISAASKKMGMLIDSLLNFSSLGRKQMQKKKVNLNALVKGVVREMQDALKGRQIHWEIEELPSVLGDQSLLSLVMVNLLSNAVKFTSTRPQAEIKIGCKDEEDKFTCSVTDNGVGFDMQYVDKLFGVFQRLHSQNEFEGTGIGLANVQRIISRHGGRVWAEGVVGQGATFYFTLPKAKEI